MKVKAEFPEGDILTLTVVAETNEIYFFKETSLAIWWYRELCEIIKN